VLYTGGTSTTEPTATGNERNPAGGYSIRNPLIALAMTNCWICSVPPKMS
jgi:hypothetical protein